MSQVIKVVYDSKDQTVSVETSGFTGTKCKDATKAIESALGKVESETLTPEAYTKEEQARIRY